MTKCILLVALMASYLFVASIHSEAQTPAKIDTTLVKNFAKINDYLEKNVDTDDLEVNIKKAEEWLESKSKLAPLFDRSLRSLKETVQTLTYLPETVENFTTCNYQTSRVLLDTCDEGLSDEIHLERKNYPLRRLDRLIESVAYKSIRLCRLGRIQPTMNFTFKLLAYDNINADLLARVDDNDPEINMKAAEDILQSLDNQEGSYARALKQLLALKTITMEDSCNEQGTEIVMKNDLATRNMVHSMNSSDTNLRRIDSLVHYYTVEHSIVCHPIYLQNCLTLLGQLDLQTYRKVLAHASAYYLKDEQFDNLIEQVNGKQVGDDFTIQLIGEDNKSCVVPDPSNIKIYGKIYQYLRDAAKHDSRFSIDESCFVTSRKSGEKFLKREKIKELYNEYVHEPCEKFSNLMESEIEILNYNWLVGGHSSKRTGDGPLNFRLLQTAFHACRYVLSFPEYYVSEIIKRFEFSDDKVIIN